MKMTWKNPNKNKKTNKLPSTSLTHLPFEQQQQEDSTADDSPSREAIGGAQNLKKDAADEIQDHEKLSQLYQQQGNQLAEDGRFREALGKWEAALILTPQRATLHEQKAQVLLELGEAWNALKAATRAAELDATWAEAWITLGRAQLNFGEPDNAINSLDRALAIKPDSAEAIDDKRIASLLIKKRKQLHSSGLSTDMNRFAVGEGGNNR